MEYICSSRPLELLPTVMQGYLPLCRIYGRIEYRDARCRRHVCTAVYIRTISLFYVHDALSDIGEHTAVPDAFLARSDAQQVECLTSD